MLTVVYYLALYFNNFKLASLRGPAEKFICDNLSPDFGAPKSIFILVLS